MVCEGTVGVWVTVHRGREWWSGKEGGEGGREGWRDGEREGEREGEKGSSEKLQCTIYDSHNSVL